MQVPFSLVLLSLVLLSEDAHMMSILRLKCQISEHIDGAKHAVPCSRALIRLTLALLGFSVFAGLWVLDAPPRASADGIQVLEHFEEVEFPGAVVFTIAATSEAEIAEVELRHRAVGQDTWSSANFDFIPGRNVTASLTLNLSGPSYIPPGAELEYYYSIRAGDGLVQQTPLWVIEYLDDRFHWDRTQVGPLLLLHHDLSDTEVAQTVEQVREALDSTGSLLPPGNGRPMKGVIYNADYEAQDALPPERLTAVGGEQVFGGFAFPAHGVFVALRFETTIIVHEAPHLLLDQALGREALPVSAWLDEGFANHRMPSDWKRFSGSSIGSEGPPISEMTKVPESPLAIATFYQKSESIVAYLIEEYGVDSFKRLIGQLARGRTTEEALMQSHGIGIAQLEALWTQDSRWPIPPAPGTRTGGPSWQDFLLVGLGSLSIVAIFVVVSAKQSSAAKSQAAYANSNVEPRVVGPGIESGRNGLVYFTAVMRKLGNSYYPIPLFILVVVAVLVIVGSVNSWAEVRNDAYVGNQIRMTSVNGTDADGYATLVVSSLALIFVIWRLASRNSSWAVLGVALVLLFISGFLGITNLFDMDASIGAFSSQNLPSLGGAFVRTGVEVGWGLIIVTVASWVGLTSGAYQYWQDHRY